MQSLLRSSGWSGELASAGRIMGVFSPIASALFFAPAAFAQTSAINPQNGHTYQLTPAAMSWTDAQAYAVSLGGNLATIRNAAEADWIMSTFASGSNARRILWIGLTDAESEGVFHWVSGEPLVYTNWGCPAQCEPNDNRSCVTSGEDWVALNWEFGNGNNNAVPGWWNDVPNGGIGPGCVGQLYLGLIELTTCAVCAADYDQDGGITGSDIGAFFADFEQGAPCADVDQDGGVTGGDLAAFFAVFEAGGC